jgi:hypothetical protein
MMNTEPELHETHRDIAERLGEHGARISALERDRSETNAQLREIRDMLHRMDNGRGSNGSQELLLNRVIDLLSKPVPPQPSIANDITAALAAVAAARPGGGAGRATGMGAIVGYVLGAASLAWLLRGILGV